MSAGFKRFPVENSHQSLLPVETATETLLLLVFQLLPVLLLLWLPAVLLLVLRGLLMLPLVPLVGLQLVHLLVLPGQQAEAEVLLQDKGPWLVMLPLYDLHHHIPFLARPSIAILMASTVVQVQKTPRGEGMIAQAPLPPHQATLHLSILEARGFPPVAHRNP